MGTLYFSSRVPRHLVKIGGATLVSPFMMPLWSTTFSLQNTGGHPYCLYECPTVIPTIVATTACRTIVATYASWSALYWRQHRSQLITPALARTVGKRWALTIGQTRLWTPLVSETTSAASMSLTARRGRQRRTHDNTNHRHTVHRSRCTASTCASSSAAAPVGAPARDSCFG